MGDSFYKVSKATGEVILFSNKAGLGLVIWLAQHTFTKPQCRVFANVLCAVCKASQYKVYLFKTFLKTDWRYAIARRLSFYMENSFYKVSKATGAVILFLIKRDWGLSFAGAAHIHKASMQSLCKCSLCCV
ncbi:hypothetical protein DCE79_02725 [Lysinibacillus sp. 2017]|nr:hypothetical protein DCE79_02725 [Lysinibacillus sp. 2017]